ncbi:MULTISPECIES: helix-turn-helix transcriptional regulator [Galbibacter]|uniref:YafY family protein n=1 Tax=Galbibacter pacificus TaxID=2996052 RepID=A0ABT6FV20_9FLAO|nr:YafY family protein [Galbibacter pacificus]MDG3583426.1 YafY family protein [Galbibacter pacificus]MDG3587097.1 YafY family protein [Galbibacter pacificus]
MSDDTIKRFDRIVTILIQLQSKKIVKAQDLADRFQVSLRTIYRDIRTLEASGVPIVSEAGVGYSIMEGYRLPPVMFTKEEAGSFIAAEKLMQHYTDESLGAYFEAAMYKIRSVLRGHEKDWISAIESQIAIRPAQDLFNKNIPNALEIIFESIAEKKQIFLKYEALHADAHTDRLIEPVGLFHENNFWYIMAYCHLRKDYRQFRTDRMVQIKRTQTPFVLEHGALEDHRKKETETAKTKVVIRIEKQIAKYIKYNCKYYGFVEEKIEGNEVEMTFMTTDVMNGFARWYLMFADYATILQPESLKTRLKEIIKEASERL